MSEPMSDKTPIGEAGTSVNVTVASRAMNIEPDLAHLKIHDEYPGKLNPLFYVVLLVTLGTAAGTFALYTSGHWIWATLLLIVTLVLAPFVHAFSKGTLNKRIAYESGLLIPAILIETQPPTLLALADMRADHEHAPIWGCLRMTVKNLPHHSMVIGEKVPCVALFGLAVQGYRRQFQPRPVAWGYSDTSLVDAALSSIAAEGDEQDEWQMLDALKDTMETAPEHEVIFFDDQLQRIEL